MIAHNDRLSNLIAGAVLHGRALRYRGLRGAEYVSEQQWELYFPTLARAQDLLLEASRADPFSGLAAAWRMTAFVDASEEEKDAAEAALLDADQVPVSGLSRLVSARARKWGGSHADMWRVARLHAEHDKPGTLSLIAKAHYEQWLWLERFEDDRNVAAGAKVYFENHDVVAELADTSRKSLREQSQSDLRNTLYADNWFAWVFWCADRHDLSRPHLQRIGRNWILRSGRCRGRVSGSTWLAFSPVYFSLDPEAM